MLPEHQYQHLLDCTSTRNRMIEELHILMVRTEVELQHVCRVLADAFQTSNPNHDHTLLHDSLVDHIQVRPRPSQTILHNHAGTK